MKLISRLFPTEEEKQSKKVEEALILQKEMERLEQDKKKANELRKSRTPEVGDYVIGRLITECLPVTEYQDIYTHGAGEYYQGTVAHGSHMAPSKWIHIKGQITEIKEPLLINIDGEWHAINSSNSLIIDHLIKP